VAKNKVITWTNERRKLSDLIPWERNPRTIKNAQAERLVDSVETFGQVETLAINPDNGVLNGHQRVSVF
jgi:ParB-like chromosome segregation protein Spo0J